MSLEVLVRVDGVKRVWQLLMPTCPVPDDAQLARWVSRFDDIEIGYAVGRLATKIRRGHFANDAESAHRYCTGILVNEREGKYVEVR